MKLPPKDESGEAPRQAASPRPRNRKVTRDPRDKRVSDLIEDARRTAARSLDLSYGGLGDVPEAIRGLQHVERINLRGNAIRVVPGWIGKLPNLKSLNISFNQLDSIPDIPGLTLDWNTFVHLRDNLSSSNISGLDILTSGDQDHAGDIRNADNLTQCVTSLPALRSLSIRRPLIFSSPLHILAPPAEISELLDRPGDCRQLTTLSISGVLLAELPASIRGLKRLKWLNILLTGLPNLPKWLSELSSLRFLRVSLCELSQLPSELYELTSLSNVNLSDNRFTEFPRVLLQLPNLVTLELQANSSLGYKGLIREIPARILDLPKLEDLNVEGQPIETPPPEVVAEGIGAIKNYWRQQREAGVDYLCEAKLLIIGEAGAGKTSLAKKIVDEKYALKPGEPSTEGIEVLQWRFPTAVRITQDGNQRMLDRDFRVYIWDFGGQEIYHATHQFFLTRRSVYALVVDDRKEDTDFNYWLQIVELLSDTSPLVIVQNEKQDRRRDINIASLRARFPNLKATYQTNLATNRGLEQLLKAIQQELERLPHIGVPMPRTWKMVREALENDQRNYIALEEYLSICEATAFIDAKTSCN